MDEAGLVIRSSSIDSADDSEVGYLGTKSLLAHAEPVTAIFAGNDSVAHGVYKALRDSDLRIPEDISVAGCDDTVGGVALSRVKHDPGISRAAGEADG